jgi:hypothetical protein
VAKPNSVQSESAAADFGQPGRYRAGVRSVLSGQAP